MAEQTPTPEQAPTDRRKPWPLIVIASLTAFWLIGPYISYYTGWFVPDETSNKGTLIEPPPVVTDLGVTILEKLPPSLTSLEDGQWQLLIPVTAPCDEACRHNLYITRQVIRRLGEKSLRVERIAVNLAGEEGISLLADLADEHPLLPHINMERGDWTHWLAQTNVPDLARRHYYLLVHPDGHAILYYTRDDSGNDLLDDIKHGLRFTPE